MSHFIRICTVCHYIQILNDMSKFNDGKSQFRKAEEKVTFFTQGLSKYEYEDRQQNVSEQFSIICDLLCAVLLMR